MTKHASQVKSQKILKLEEELQARQKGITDQFKQLKQTDNDRVSVTNDQVNNE